MGLSLMSSAVNEVQFPIANGSVSSRLNLRNSKLRARSLQIVGGRFRNLKFVQNNRMFRCNTTRLLVLCQIEDSQQF